MDSYRLPFPKGTFLWCTQGNNNPSGSHTPGTKAAFAFDFSTAPGDADEGQLLVAAAPGTVVMMREDTPDHVTGNAGRGRGNYVVILHDDGFCDIYMHLKHASVSEFGLAVGTAVSQGQPVGRLGKTGFCFGAHLHFQRQHFGESYWQQSVPVTFEDVPGDGIPRAGHSYTSQNEQTVQPPTSLKEALESLTSQRTRALLDPSRVFAAVAQQENLGAALSGISLLTAPDTKQYHVQIFEADTLFLHSTAPVDKNNVGRVSTLLAANPSDTLGLALWRHTYSNAALTFEPRWASHQYALNQFATSPLGAPLGGGTTNGVHVQAIEGKLYEASVYAEDTIYWISGIWGDIRRLSALQQRNALQQWLQEITAKRTEVVLDPARAFSEAAKQANAGAPLSGLAQLTAPNGTRFYVQVFEADTLFVGTTPPVIEGNVGRMSALLIANPNDSWGRKLWEHTYANAGLTFQSFWASHLFVLNQLANKPLGAPLGGGSTNGVHSRVIDGKTHEIEVYAKDTIYWIPPAWGTILRMSDLP